MHQGQSLFKAYFALVIVCFFWGTTYLVIKIGVSEMPGFIFAGFRNILAGLLTCMFFLLRGHRLPDHITLKTLVGRGILLIVIGNALVHWAEQFIPSGLTAILAAMVPLFIAGISAAFFKSTRLNFKIIAGIVIGFLGILVIFYDSLQELANPAYLLGTLAVLVAAFGWALGSVYSAIKKLDINPIFGAGIQMFSAGIISVGIGFSIGERVDLLNLHPHSLWSIIYLALIGSILSYNAYMYALSKLPATRVSVYAYINTIVAVVLGWMILNETITVSMITGMGLTLLGVYLVNRGFNLKSIKIKPVSPQEVLKKAS